MRVTAVAVSLALGLAWAGPAWSACAGDCDRDGVVTADEIVTGTGVRLGEIPVSLCPAADVGGDGQVGAPELVAAVESALAGCPDRLAFVTATDFETGSFAVVGLDEPREVQGSTPERRIHGDATARTRGELVYVVNRFLGDNIQVLDPADEFRTLWQCSTGPGSNPHDIAIVHAGKAYVSRSDDTALWIVDPSAPPGCDGFKTGEIDLSSLADADGIPEMDQMAIIGDRLYVLLQFLDRDAIFAPAGRGRIAVIDTGTDQLVGEIVLSGENPFAQTKGLPVWGGKLVVASTGLYTVADGGIEFVDVESGVAEGFFITEEDLGGDITDFVLVSDRLGYAVLSKADFSNALVAFDPVERRVTKTLLSGDIFISDIEQNTRGELFAADRSFTAPGLRIFRAADGEPLSDRLDTGLPPFDIIFLK
jgi:hypothetical protein